MMNYDYLIDSIDGWDKDWEIVVIPFDNVIIPIINISPHKYTTYYRAIKKGVEFPPIAITKDNRMYDGLHRYKVYMNLNYKKIPVIREYGPGHGRIVKDDYYTKKKGSFTKPYSGKNGEETMCISCKRMLSWMPYGLSHVGLPEFPHGMPSGPYYFCQPCGLIINPNRFIVWT